MQSRRWPLIALMIVFPLACGEDPGPVSGPRVKPEDGKADASADAVFLQFEFDGEALVQNAYNPQRLIEDLLLYTVGQLNGERSVGRLDLLEVTAVQTEAVEGGTRISYHARLPVAWGKKDSVPESYRFKLPRRAGTAGIEAFTQKYMHSCVDSHAHDVDAGIMWYYYRPGRSGCTLDPEDIIESEAVVTPSTLGTTGKFPEYDKIWEDEELRVLAVFGKFEDDATSSGDAGISAFNRFVRVVKDDLSAFSVETVPAEVPLNPGVALPDIEFRATLPDGKRVVVNALLVDSVRSAGAEFDQRYGELSQRADLIAYNGHSGLGANIRALARKGQWVQGQYVVVFMNGCDTYAYVDSALFEAHAQVNPDDPAGTKHTDIVMNAMPSMFSSMANATLAILRGLMKFEEPKTFEQIFAGIDRYQVVLVSGEEDNVYVPGGGGEPEPWSGLDASGSVARDEEVRFETPTLAAGTYRFSMTGTGDADLYVRIGSAPTTALYDCRPYLDGSSESCQVELPAPATVHLMVRGYDPASDFQLQGSPAPL